MIYGKNGANNHFGTDNMRSIAIIGGSGLYEFSALKGVEHLTVDTVCGAPSSAVYKGHILADKGDAAIPLLFLPRHGAGHTIAPHHINYRANLLALKQLGATHVIAVNAVGGIAEQMKTGAIVIPHQIIDYTYGREHSYSGESIKLGPNDDMISVNYADFTHPYDESLRAALLTAGQSLKLNMVDGGVYGATQGPRLETAAEIIRYERDGVDMVGMTGMPEAALARELGMAYASVCLVVNKAAGKAEGEITLEEVKAVMSSGIEQVERLIVRFLKKSND